MAKGFMWFLKPLKQAAVTKGLCTMQVIMRPAWTAPKEKDNNAYECFLLCSNQLCI